MKKLKINIAAVITLLTLGCSANENNGDADISVIDSNTVIDKSSDTNNDSNTDNDTAIDTDSDTGINSDTDSNTDSETGTNSDTGSDTNSFINADCEDLVTNPDINWRESSLKTDQEIVECLATSLGRPVGYGEKALGGYDPSGGSNLVIIKKNSIDSVEQQIADAVGSSEHNWIVFDKNDFKNPSEIALYRLRCDEPDVLAALDTADVNECKDYKSWCSSHSVSSDDCLEEFFNVRLNDKDLPIRNIEISSNTTIDGRQSKAYFLFSGFSIGAADGDTPTNIASNVIVTNLLFQGAGHTEDHGLDPDMVRSTGASHDIWINKNTFDTTGDSAFDVKVGAYNITISFNLLRNVKRAALHGSSDSREINDQIATTIHDNAFITTDDYYEYFGGGGRRVPLIRGGRTHMFNNVFYGYRKDILSVRVGARVAFEDNMFMVDTNNPEDDDIDYLVTNLLRDFEDGSLEITGSYVWMSDTSCNVDSSDKGDLTASNGTTPDMLSDYSDTSKNSINANLIPAGQDLADYVLATAGRDGEIPFNSSFSKGKDAILAMPHVSCQ